MYHQGLFKPRHPEKYRGNVRNIIYRSSWERMFCNWCDTVSTVLEWSSEETIVYYRNPHTNTTHRYFPDFRIVVKDRDGNRQTYLVEVKPFAETQKPKPQKRKTKRYLAECDTYIKNRFKWNAARDYAARKGWKFKVVTEYDMGLKKR